MEPADSGGGEPGAPPRPSSDALRPRSLVPSRGVTSGVVEGLRRRPLRPETRGQRLHSRIRVRVSRVDTDCSLHRRNSDGIRCRISVTLHMRGDTLRDAVITLVATAATAGHLVLRVAGASTLLQNLPLWIALAGGGTILVARLAWKAVGGEFGSDQLAGGSIVAATLVGQYQIGKAACGLPIWIALAGGGTILVARLAWKAVGGEFGSDQLAGVSIVAATLLGQY